MRKFNYYMCFDTTKEYSSIYHALYIKEYANRDILGVIIEFAKRNNTNIDDIRLFAFASKKEWDTSYENYIRQIKL